MDKILYQIICFDLSPKFLCLNQNHTNSNLWQNIISAILLIFDDYFFLFIVSRQFFSVTFELLLHIFSIF